MNSNEIVAICTSEKDANDIKGKIEDERSDINEVSIEKVSTNQYLGMYKRLKNIKKGQRKNFRYLFYIENF